MSKQAYKRLRRSLGMDVNRKPLDSFAWPGGYPIYYIGADGDYLCADCVNANVAEIADATRDLQRERASYGQLQWALTGHDVHWEGPPLTCCHCDGEIASAYGNPDEPADVPAARE